VTKLAVREEFDHDDVECTDNDDDKQHGLTVPSEMEISDIVHGIFFFLLNLLYYPTM